MIRIPQDMKKNLKGIGENYLKDALEHVQYDVAEAIEYFAGDDEGTEKFDAHYKIALLEMQRIIDKELKSLS
jgi:hypothetical protein